MSRLGVEACNLSAALLRQAGKASRRNLERLAAALGLETHSRRPLHLLADDVEAAIRRQNREDDLEAAEARRVARKGRAA